MFQGGQQHDSQELLLLLIDCLVDSLTYTASDGEKVWGLEGKGGSGGRPASVSAPPPPPVPSSPCADIFSGSTCGLTPLFETTFVHQYDTACAGIVTCGRCGSRSSMKEVFTVLSLSLAGLQQQQQQQPQSESKAPPSVTVPPPVVSSQSGAPLPSPTASAPSPHPPTGNKPPSNSPFSWFRNICKTQLPFLFSDFSILRAPRELRCRVF
jgi:hypothetical protein